jgi:predicted DNA-binding protein (MmcQ/YjbR family)
MVASVVTAAVKARLLAKPGAVAEPAAIKGHFLFKVMGRMFAILSERTDPNVSLKCDSHLAEILRERYAGIGHRYHLDRRHWINVALDADVPDEEVLRLADQSYDLVCAGLTRKQRAELSARAAEVPRSDGDEPVEGFRHGTAPG